MIGRRNRGEDLVDEPTLVRRVQGGDESAFGVLVERYVDSGFAAAMAVLGNPHDAEDAVQNAFIRALERIEQLAAGKSFRALVLPGVAIDVAEPETPRGPEVA